MKTDTSYFLIGVFVIVGTILLTAATIILGAGGVGPNALKAYTLLQESVTGLERGAVVRFRGVEVGKVEKVTMAAAEFNTEKDYIAVFFTVTPQRRMGTLEELRASVSRELNRGLRIRLASSGISGQAYLEWDIMENADEKYPPLERPWVEPGEEEEYMYVPSASSTLTSFVNSLRHVLGNLEKTDIQGLVDEGREALKTANTKLDDLDTKKISDDVVVLLEKTTEAVESIDKEAKEFLDAATSAANEVEKLVADPKIQDILVNIKSSTANIDELLADPKLKSTIANIEALTSEARDAVKDVQDALRPARQLLADARNAIKSKDRDVGLILKNIASLTQHLENLSRTLEKYPSFALFGNPPEKKGPRK